MAANISKSRNGFKINGDQVEGYSGSSVSYAGDVNGDGIADIIIGAPQVSHNHVGQSEVVFGSFIPSSHHESSNLASYVCVAVGVLISAVVVTVFAKQKGILCFKHDDYKEVVGDTPLNDIT